MNILIIRVDGTEENHKGQFTDISRLIGARYLDSVNLRDGRMMMVDDAGYETTAESRDPATAPLVAGEKPGFYMELVPGKARKPVNQKATTLYHGVCVPGTTHQIVGDVAIIIDAELA